MYDISLLNLSYLLIPLIFVGWVYARWTGVKYELAYATLRMLIQLIIVGYVLVFIFTYQYSWLGGLILLFMLSVSASIIFRQTQDKSVKHFALIFIAVFLSSAINLGLVFLAVLQLEPLYQPRYIIPLAGMVLSVSINAIALAVERFEEELHHQINFIEARNIAVKAAMIPPINALLAVGVVALPGMMTGQILSGVDPLIAVRYQMLIMIISISGAGMSVIFYFYLKARLGMTTLK